MTVKELIEQLQQVENQDIEVVIKGTGPDSWIYMNEIEDIKQTYTMMVEDEGLIEIDEDDVDEDDEVTQVLVIDGGMF
jgi:ketosteroid isomerase-like protein